MFEHTDVRYIKLGQAGCWEHACRFEDSTLRLGYESNQHRECMEGKWDAVREHWRRVRNGNSASAQRDVNQIQAFYELPESTVWITFHGGLMYWCHANSRVHERADGTRERYTVDGWHCTDANSSPLRISELDGRLTKVQAFRGTICEVQDPAYALRRIRGEPEPDVVVAESTKTELERSLANLIDGLWWGDFELLVDLIFTNSGWQRVSRLGKDQKSLDLELYSPATGRRAFVQVKSQADPSAFIESVNAFEEHRLDEMYFICHKFTGNRPHIRDQRCFFWDRDQLATLTCDLGLTRWLINKRR